jgi:hypothetical protein
VPSKLQSWNCFNPTKKYHWAKKWNGVKGKLIVNNDHTTYFWPDASDIIITKTDVKDVNFFNKFFNVCIQVEILEDSIVCVEILAASYDDDIHYVEPQTNLRIINWFNDIFREYGVVSLYPKKLLIQQFIHSTVERLPLEKKVNFSETYDYDGFIIIQDDIIIKWKSPTFDARFIEKNKFQIDHSTIEIADDDVKYC